MIQAKQLTKTFGKFTAVNKVDLTINRGECFGLLGPNGAGKSTFINMVYGASERTSGELKVFDLDPSTDAQAIKSRLGVVTQINALDESLTVHENMQIYAAYHGWPRVKAHEKIEQLLRYMNLENKAHDKIQTLSGGMQRRLVFVRALIADPELLILDEPTTGLDPAVRHLLWGKIQDLKRDGKTLLLTTHYMHEAEILCDRIAVINQGQLLDISTPTKLIDKYSPGFVAVFSLAEDDPRREQISQESSRLSELQVMSDKSGLYVRAPQIEQLIEFSKKLAMRPSQMRPSNLEDVFLQLTGRELAHHA